MVPIDQIDGIFNEFFINSWEFIYKFIIYLLKTNQSIILEEDNSPEMILHIKKFKPKNTLFSMIPFFNNIFQTSDWNPFIENAKKLILVESV